MAKTYRVLRGYLTAAGIEQIYLAEQMGVSLSYVSSRITGKAPWDLEDMYFIMDMLHLSYDKLHIVFPKNGRAPLGAIPRLDEAVSQ